MTENLRLYSVEIRHKGNDACRVCSTKFQRRRHSIDSLCPKEMGLEHAKDLVCIWPLT